MPLETEMKEYIECQNCGFVLLAASGDEPEPKGWEKCPECGSDEFQFS